MTIPGEYFERTAGLSLEALGVHAFAAAIAATSDVAAVSRALLTAQGMTPELERELLETGVLRLAGADVLAVDVEPLTGAQVLLEARRSAERDRWRRRREHPASSGQDSADSAESRDSAEGSQIAGAAAGPQPSTPLTRARGRAAHTHPPLLNVLTTREEKGEHVESTTHTRVARERVRDALARAFRPEEIADDGVDAAILLAELNGIDPFAAALRAVTMGAGRNWKLKEAGATMAIAVEKLVKASAAAAPLSSPGTTAATEECPRPALTADQRELVDERRTQLLAAVRDQVTDTTYGLWLSHLQVHQVTPTVVIAAPSNVAGWIAERHHDTLEAAWSTITGGWQPIAIVPCSCAGTDPLARSA